MTWSGIEYYSSRVNKLIFNWSPCNICIISRPNHFREGVDEGLFGNVTDWKLNPGYSNKEHNASFKHNY